MRLPQQYLSELTLTGPCAVEEQILLRRYMRLVQWSCLELISERRRPDIRELKGNWDLFYHMEIEGGRFRAAQS